MTTSEDRILIVGAGQAGARAAEALRSAGHRGPVVLLGEELHLPYERPQLSKEFLLAPAPHVVSIKDAATWAAIDITVHMGASAVEWDIERRRVVLADGRAFPYDRLLFATGTGARRLPALEGRGVPVRYLRTIEDAQSLRADLVTDRSIVIVGGGVIGLEVAAAAMKAGCVVTVIEAAETLLSRALPAEVGAFLLRRHRAAGVEFRFGVVVDAVRDGAVILSDGTSLSTDAIVVGVGAVPRTELATRSGLTASEGIRVDPFGRTDVEGVFAAGDVASQWDPLRKRWRRVETWANAQNQAIAVAHTMAGQPTAYGDPPWFWTDQYDVNVQVVGDTNFGDLVFRGDPETGRFTVLCIDGGVIRGAVTINRRPDMAALRRAVAMATPIERREIEDVKLDLRKVLA